MWIEFVIYATGPPKAWNDVQPNIANDSASVAENNVSLTSFPSQSIWGLYWGFFDATLVPSILSTSFRM
jgi:hypothetical protein